MQNTRACPICEQNCWHLIGERVHSYKDRERLTKYELARYDVLFKIWMPGQTTARFRSHLCTNCGFVTNFPRPEPADVDAKYRFLEEHIQDYGEKESIAIEESRSELLWRHLKPQLPPHGEILDFGGGDGRLMKQFAKNGFSCSLVDYNQTPRSFVHRIACTLSEMPPDKKFEAIVCSHVLEHVVDPVGEMRKLSKHLKPDGVFYIEVPLEIWKRAPLHSEPVTHLNFFTRDSLNWAICAAGFQVTSCEYFGSLHPSGNVLPAIRAQGTSLSQDPRTKSSGPQEVRSLLNPGLFQKLKRRWYLSKGKRELRSVQLDKG